jgi:DNA-binding IclR family transcriptional regulator
MPDPRRDIKALARLQAFLEKPRSLAEICALMRCSRRTAYRRIRYLEFEEACEVVKRRGADLVTRFVCGST